MCVNLMLKVKQLPHQCGVLLYRQQKKLGKSGKENKEKSRKVKILSTTCFWIVTFVKLNFKKIMIVTYKLPSITTLK